MPGIGRSINSDSSSGASVTCGPVGLVLCIKCQQSARLSLNLNQLIHLAAQCVFGLAPERTKHVDPMTFAAPLIVASPVIVTVRVRQRRQN
jgi:hypothetical protein